MRIFFFLLLLYSFCLPPVDHFTISCKTERLETRSPDLHKLYTHSFISCWRLHCSEFVPTRIVHKQLINPERPLKLDSERNGMERSTTVKSKKSVISSNSCGEH